MTYLPSSTISALNSIQSQLNEVKGLLRQYKQGFYGLTIHPGWQARWFQGNLCSGTSMYVSNGLVTEWQHSWLETLALDADVLRHYWSATDPAIPVTVKFPIGENVIYRQWFVRDAEDNQEVTISVNSKPLLVSYNVANHLSPYSWGFRDFKIAIDEMSQGFTLEYASSNDQETKMHVFQLFPDN